MRRLGSRRLGNPPTRYLTLRFTVEGGRDQAGRPDLQPTLTNWATAQCCVGTSVTTRLYLDGSRIILYGGGGGWLAQAQEKVLQKGKFIG